MIDETTGQFCRFALKNCRATSSGRYLATRAVPCPKKPPGPYSERDTVQCVQSISAEGPEADCSPSVPQIGSRRKPSGRAKCRSYFRRPAMRPYDQYLLWNPKD